MLEIALALVGHVKLARKLHMARGPHVGQRCLRVLEFLLNDYVLSSDFCDYQSKLDDYLTDAHKPNTELL